MVALNPIDAKACCVCRHWKPLAGLLSKTGECRHPEKRWGVTYRLPDGSDQHVEWWTTGCYATCSRWEISVPDGSKSSYAPGVSSK